MLGKQFALELNIVRRFIEVSLLDREAIAYAHCKKDQAEDQQISRKIRNLNAVCCGSLCSPGFDH